MKKNLLCLLLLVSATNVFSQYWWQKLANQPQTNSSNIFDCFGFVGHNDTFYISGRGNFSGRYRGCLYKSTDLGKTWQPASYNFSPNTAVDAYHHTGASILAGIINFSVNNNFVLKVSDDEGKTWIAAKGIDTLGHDIKDVFAMDKNTLVAVGNSNNPSGMVAYRSTDNGYNWQKMNSGAPDSFVMSHIEIIKGRIFVSGSKTSSTGGYTVYYSDDTMATWKGVGAGGISGGILIRNFASKDGKNIVAIGQNPSFYKIFKVYFSNDGGINWVENNYTFSTGLPSGYVPAVIHHKDNFYAVFWADKSNGYNSTIYKSSALLSIKQAASTTISLFPNPATNAITLKNETDDEVFEQIEIYDLLGKKVDEFKNIGAEIPVAALAKGIYFVKAISGDTYFVTKFVKE